MMEKFRIIIYARVHCLIPMYEKLRVQNKMLTKNN